MVDLHKHLQARFMSLRGRHAAAMLLDDASPAILSPAGMHLTVRKAATKPDIYYKLALVHTGKAEAVFELLSLLHIGPRTRRLVGMLAATDPHRMLPFIADNCNYDDVAGFCRIMVGEGTASSHMPTTPSPLMQNFVALKTGNLSQAEAGFSAAFTQSGIAAPQNDWSTGRIDVNNLSGGKGKPVFDGPLITVVLAAFNEQDYLASAVRSLLDQDWQSLEILIINDGSTDKTGQIADDLANRDRRVRAIHLPENVGLWRAKNIGFGEARGELITMHDADDWSHPAKLRLQATPLLEDPQLACTSSYFFRVDEETGGPFTRDATMFLRWNPSSLMFRADLTQKIGDFYVDILGSDCEFVARVEMLLGPHSHRRIGGKPLSIGWQRANSLSNRFRTGTTENGIERRIRHWEAWRRLHLQGLRQNTTRIFGHGHKVADFFDLGSARTS